MLSFLSLYLYIFSMNTSFCIFLLLADKTIKLWKVTERDRKPEGFNLKDETGILRDPASIHALVVSSPMYYKPIRDKRPLMMTSYKMYLSDKS